MSKQSINNRASAIASRSIEIEFTESKVPDPSPDFAATVQASSKAHIDFSNFFTIDVLPDFSKIICYVIYHAVKYAALLDTSAHAKVSVPSFIMYCMIIVYGRFLLCDIHLRQPPSVHAQLWIESAHRARFADFILSLPVPDFLEPLLKAFTPCTDDTRKNVEFMPSAAGYSYSKHFGRFFPINMFANIHDCSAEMAGNSPTNDILRDLFSRVIYTVNNATAGTNFSCNIGNLIAFGFPSGNANTISHYGSRIYQIFSSMFNPVLFRDYQRRKNLASISLRPQTYSSVDHNAYDIFFCASGPNLSELQVVCTAIAASMKGNISCKGDLASYFKTLSGTELLRHGYAKFALPSFFHSPATIPTGNTRTALVSPSDFATVIKFMQTPAPTIATTPAQITGTCDTDRTHRVSLTNNQWPWSLLHVTGSTTTAPQPSFTRDFELFNEDLNLFPNVYVMHPHDPSTVDAWKATIFGMVIESVDLDASVVPHPNPDLSLGIENTFFAESAIAYRHIYNATGFRAANTTTTPITRSRVRPSRQTRFASASILINRTQINVPRPRPTVATFGNQDNWLAGLTVINHVNWSQPMQSFIGFNTCDNRSNTTGTDDAVSGMQSGRLVLWSPYSFTATWDSDDVTPQYSSTRIYAITNLRTIFGTRVPLVEVAHANHSLPVA